MRNHRELDSGEGVVCSDTDYIILRCHQQGDRNFQMLMVVEVKQYGARPGRCQTDILSFLRQLAERKGRNSSGAETILSMRLYSKLLKRPVLVRWLGVHLLQFEKTSPEDSAWIKWDGRDITAPLLVELLRMDRRPDAPDRLMTEFLRNHHRPDRSPAFAFLNA
jgi:hypothetical protein